MPSIWVVQRILSNLFIVRFLSLILVPLLIFYFQMPDGQFDNLVALQLTVPSSNIISLLPSPLPNNFLFLAMGTWNYLNNLCLLWLCKIISHIQSLIISHIQSLRKSYDAFFKHYTLFSLFTALDQIITTSSHYILILSYAFSPNLDNMTARLVP